MKKNLILAAIGIAIFFGGRFTAHRTPVNNHAVIDSLTHDIAVAVKELAKYKDSVRFYSVKADLAIIEANRIPKEKIIYRKIYLHEVNKIDSLPDSALVARLVARYKP